MKRERLVPTFVLLGVLLVLLIACSRLTNEPGAPNPTARPPGVERALDQWLKDYADSWLSRVTNVVTIVGIALAVKAYHVSVRQLRTGEQQLQHQLAEIRRQQEYVADELGRRPQLRIGFIRQEDEGTGNLWSSIRFAAPASLTQNPVTRRIGIGLQNEGRRTAHHLTASVFLANGLTEPGFRPTPFTSNTTWYEFPMRDSLHPEEILPIVLTLTFSRHYVDYEVIVAVAYDDYPKTKTLLAIGVSPDPPDPQRTWERVTLPALQD